MLKLPPESVLTNGTTIHESDEQLIFYAKTVRSAHYGARVMLLIGLKKREKHEIGNTGSPLKVFGVRIFQNCVKHENSLPETANTFDGGIL